MLKLILVRHGESIANKRGVYQGHTYDTNLTALGRRQTQVLSKQLVNREIKAIFTSPLKRALETAHTVADELNTPVVVNKDLIEIDHGNWEGKTKKEVERLYPKILNLWKKAPKEATMPNGENLVDVQERVRRFLHNLKQIYQKGTFLIVSHDTTLRVMVAEILGLPLNSIWRFHLDNAALTIVQWGSQGELLTLNNSEYLKRNRSNTDGQAL